MTTTEERLDLPEAGSGYPTVAASIFERAQETPHAVAMRDKNFGIWRETTWGALWDQIHTAAHGLSARNASSL